MIYHEYPMRNLFTATAAGLLLLGCKVQNVDMAQPIAVANEFYGALTRGDEKFALSEFAPEFKAQEQDWPRLLNNLQQKYGRVTSSSLQQAKLAANGNDPCYLLTFSVKRGELDSNELLFICAKQNRPPWRIVGHSLVRLDTNQSISGGMFPSEVEVRAP